MRVVDLRSTAAAPRLDIEPRVSSAAELLRFLSVLLAETPGDFDIGVDRIEQARAALPPELLAEARELSDLPKATGPGHDVAMKCFVGLAVLGAVLPEPAGVAELLSHLDEDPTVCWRLLLGHAIKDLPRGVDLADRLRAGDDAALERVRALAADSELGSSARRLLDADARRYNERVATLVAATHDAVWRDLEAEALGPVERDVAFRREQLASGTAASEVVLQATNGYELTDEPGLERVVLLPSYWFRPWIVLGRLQPSVEVISTVVADEFLALPSEAPPPALLKLFKALSDEGRLKLLRRMSSGPIRLGDASDELSVAKATAHHHLSILRQAGLVSMRGEGRTTRYALREDPPTAAREALAAYVPPRRG